MAETESFPVVLTEEAAIERLSGDAMLQYWNRESQSKDDALTPNQLVVHALVTKTCDDYSQSTPLFFLQTALMAAFFVVLTTGFCFGAIAGAYWVLVWIFGDCPNWVIYLLPAMVLVVGWALKDSVVETKIDLEKTNNQWDGFQLGRLHSVFSWMSMVYVAFSLSGLFSSHVGLLYFTDTHGGVEFEGGFWTCFRIAADNFCRGAFMDVFELYGIDIVDTKIQHSNWSRTIFQMYRILYAGYVIGALLIIYRRVRMAKFFAGLYEDSTGADGDTKSRRKRRNEKDKLVDWIEQLSRSSQQWHRNFADEFIFLMICEEYLRGDYTLVRQVSRQFPRLNVTTEVRALFTTANGEPLFEKAP